MIALRYHQSTKHGFNRFARSLGYLDWASQPDPFRRYAGAPVRTLPRVDLASDLPYPSLYGQSNPVQPVDDHSIGEFLRCSMGLSAWKQYGHSRWALRVNPSSGNLHPTEAWIVHDGRIFHYDPREHALEQRCLLHPEPDRDLVIEGTPTFIVALTTITWREAWKYGERAFRYCQHDIGHALGAMRLSASRLGWQMQLLPQWSDDQLAALLGLDRGDHESAEREEPMCLARVGAWSTEATTSIGIDAGALVDAAIHGQWTGTPNRLSAGRVDWPIIDEVVRATRYPGRASPDARPAAAAALDSAGAVLPASTRVSDPPSARAVILQRRSALAFDRRGVLARDRWFEMLGRLQPLAPPWDAIDWPAQVHLVMFVHRVEDVPPGIYAYFRDSTAAAEWKSAMRPDFMWEPTGLANLFLLVPINAGETARRLSCDQEIAGDGFFSLGMVARFEPALVEHGDWFYRRLFWECGLIGQLLYLEAEAAGARATGIGCFYDDPVHDLLGLSGHAWQSLYHFSMGLPIDDARLTTDPGYEWEP